jgi:hypothetical protein
MPHPSRTTSWYLKVSEGPLEGELDVRLVENPANVGVALPGEAGQPPQRLQLVRADLRARSLFLSFYRSVCLYLCPPP